MGLEGVECGGVGTARPEVCDAAHRDWEYAHLEPVLARYAALDSRDPARSRLRGQLIVGFLPVAGHIARRFASRGRGVSYDDLSQVGTVGLIKAVDRYDPAHGVNFLAYAVPTIRGEILRYFRDHTWAMRVPRRIKDLTVSVRHATSALVTQLGRAPRPGEIAAWLDVGTEEVLEALQADHECTIGSLDAPAGDGDANDGVVALLGQADARLELVEGGCSVAPLIAELPERERTILMLRFFADMTQTQIADQIGVSQMHISRLLSQTLTRLRRQLDDQGAPLAETEPAGCGRAPITKTTGNGPGMTVESGEIAMVSSSPLKHHTRRRRSPATVEDHRGGDGGEHTNPVVAPVARPAYPACDPWRAAIGSTAAGTLPALAIPAPRKVVAVSTHLGEVLCAAGGMLSALAWAGAEVHVLVIAEDDGTAPGTRALCNRRWRTRTAFPLLGLSADRRYRLSLSSGALRGPGSTTHPGDRGAEPAQADVRADLSGALSELVGHDDPKDVVLLAPWSHDGHPDHELAGSVSEHIAQTYQLRLLSYLIGHWSLPEPLAAAPASARRFSVPTALRERDRALRHLALPPPNPCAKPETQTPGTPRCAEWEVVLTHPYR